MNLSPARRRVFRRIRFLTTKRHCPTGTVYAKSGRPNAPPADTSASVTTRPAYVAESRQGRKRGRDTPGDRARIFSLISRPISASPHIAEVPPERHLIHEVVRASGLIDLVVRNHPSLMGEENDIQPINATNAPRSVLLLYILQIIGKWAMRRRIETEISSKRLRTPVDSDEYAQIPKRACSEETQRVPHPVVLMCQMRYHVNTIGRAGMGIVVALVGISRPFYPYRFTLIMLVSREVHPIHGLRRTNFPLLRYMVVTHGGPRRQVRVAGLANYRIVGFRTRGIYILWVQ